MTSKIPEIDGSRDWPAIKWAAKDQDHNWVFFISDKQPVWNRGEWTGYQYMLNIEKIPNLNWRPPQWILDMMLPPEKSLVKLK